MGEDEVKLLEQTVQNNTEDVRDLKTRVKDLEDKTTKQDNQQQLTNQTVTHILEKLTDLSVSFRQLDDKLDRDKEEQLKAYKGAIWKVAIIVVGAFLVAQFGLK